MSSGIFLGIALNSGVREILQVLCQEHLNRAKEISAWPCQSFCLQTEVWAPSAAAVTTVDRGPFLSEGDRGGEAINIGQVGGSFNSNRGIWTPSELNVSAEQPSY